MQTISWNRTNRLIYPLFGKILAILVFLHMVKCSVEIGKNNRETVGTSRNRHFNYEEDSDWWGTQTLGLVGLFGDNQDEMATKEYSNGFGKKRFIRSPLDDEIDEVEDSEESDENENDEDKSIKNDDTTIPTTTTTNVHSSVSQSNKTENSSNTNMNIRTSTGSQIPTNYSKSNSQHLLNISTNSKPHTPVPHGRPGVPVLVGGGPVRKTPPGFVPPFPGKLPPNFLKNLPKPKPPPKKGELYLPKDYNNLVIPKLNLGRLIGIDSYSAVPVLVFLNIRSVRDIDETMETLTLDLDLVIEWVDGFLFDPISAVTTRQPDITLNPIFLKKIWRPDIYIDEIVKVKRTSLMSKPLKLKFNPSNGFISYTTRLTVQLNCDMLYFYYPADTHRCEFTFRSYSYFSKDMELSWLGTGVYLQDPYDPNFDLQVESIDRVKLPQTFRKLTNDTFDGLKFTVLARRKLSFHMVQTYLPSIFFIVITWLCFLVPARMVEARIGISMTTLLTLTSMFASVRESTPSVSYVKAIDTWMVFCIFFVFLTLLEFATFVWLRSRREDAEEKKLEQARKDQEERGNGKGKELGTGLSRSLSVESISLRKYERFAEFTEKFAFFIFSSVFLIFNVIYWSWLLTASDYFDWNVNGTLNAEVD